MNKLNALWLAWALWLGLSASALAQCPNCTISLPPNIQAASTDTMHLDSIPPGQKNVYYEENISFRLPQTTNPINAVDPGVPAGITINSITIQSVSGLPSGMNYKLDRNPAVYNETAPNARDGCVTFCGTPAQSGMFEVFINVLVNVAVLGDVNYTIDLDFYVAPDSSATFTLDNNNICDSGWVSVTNLVPSNGAPGVSYSWNFGNGTTSTQENPDSVFYSAPGVYAVTQRVIIDTFPYNLRRVIVTASNCNDDVPPFSTGAPDFYMILKDGSGTVLINNDPNTPPVVGTPKNLYPPDTVWTGVQQLTVGQTYTIEIWDDDNDVLNADDPCGTFSFQATTSQVNFVNGAHSINIWIEHYVDTIEYVDSVYILNCSGVAELSPLETSFQVYPNPSATGAFNLRFDLPQGVEQAEWTVSDLLGRTLLRRDLGALPSGNFQETLDLQAQGSGIYLLQLRLGDQRLNRRVIVR